MKPLYQKSFTINNLKTYFSPYFVGMTRPTTEKNFLFILAVLALQSIQSIRHVHHWFLKRISSKSLTAFYYLFSDTNASLTGWSQVTAHLALTCIPNQYERYLVFLIIDDTLQPKFGTHFDDYHVMFDHAQHIRDSQRIRARFSFVTAGTRKGPYEKWYPRIHD